MAACLMVGFGLTGLAQGNLSPAGAPQNQQAVEMLAREVARVGWIVYSGKTERGDWDLLVMRPDGSQRRNLTDTPEFNEAGARISPDGKRLLYYRLPKKAPVANNTYGKYDLVIADANGQHAVVYGADYPWAAWSPDSQQIACLTPKGIQIVNLADRKVVRQLPRQGIVQQLGWSADGKWFLGTANGLGPFWNIGRLNVASGQINAVSETDRYNCTPDWVPNASEVVYARGIIPEKGGYAEMWVARGDGQEKQMLYAEATRHIYGACVSPDGQYLIFTRSVEDLGENDSAQVTLSLIRRRDTPMVGESNNALLKRFPNAKPGPRLDLGKGWEPHWTSAEMDASK
jgi:Tol biopolymer transport system component